MSRRSEHYVSGMNKSQGNRHDIRSQPKAVGHHSTFRHDAPKKLKPQRILKGGLD